MNTSTLVKIGDEWVFVRLVWTWIQKFSMIGKVINIFHHSLVFHISATINIQYLKKEILLFQQLI